MSQKGTIVKCGKSNCLWNHHGTCDQYVITIGVDNSCKAYTETEEIKPTENNQAGELNICWWCDYFHPNHPVKRCACSNPEIFGDICHSVKSTGGNR